MPSQKVLSALTFAVGVTKDIGDTLAIPPLSGSASLVLRLLKIIQTASNNRALLGLLGQRACEVVLFVRDRIVSHCGQNDERAWDLITPEFAANIDSFEDTLRAILQFVTDEGKRSWFKAFFRQNNLKSRIDRYTCLLDDAQRNFQAATVIDVHRLTSLNVQYSRALVQRVDGLTDDIGVIRRRFDEPDMRLSLRDQSGLRLFYPSDLTIQNETNISTGWWSNTNEAEIEGTTGRRTVKWYQGQVAKSQFLRDVTRIQRLTKRRHTGLLQLFGRSHFNVSTPFLVLSHSGCRDIKSQIQFAFHSATMVQACLLATEIAYEISSTVSFLWGNKVIKSHADMRRLLDVSNMVLDGNGHIIFGANLSPDDNQDNSDDAASGDPNLIGDRWTICRQIFDISTYTSMPTPLTDVDRKKRVAQGLMWKVSDPFSNSHEQSLPDGLKLGGVYRAHQPHSTSLSLQEFRKQITSILSLGSYRTETDVGWGKVGDIIHWQENKTERLNEGLGKFVVLENAGALLEPRKDFVDDVKFWGDYDQMITTALPNNLIRYTFVNALSVDFKASKVKQYLDTVVCWKWFLANALRIAQTYSCNPHELILVTGTDEETQCGVFKRHSTLPSAPDESEIPADIYLFGSFEDSGFRWCWSLDPENPPSAADTASYWSQFTDMECSTRRHGFTTCYVQLEPQDFIQEEKSSASVEELPLEASTSFA